MVAQLKGCCCGCSLKTGTIIIGAFELVFFVPLWIRFVFLTIFSLRNSDVSAIPGQIAVFSAIDILLGIGILFSVILLYGANNERPSLLKAWLIYAIILTILGTVMEVMVIILNHGFIHYETHIMAIRFTSLIVAIVLKVYYILVVNSFHTQLIQGTQWDNEIGLQTKE